MKAKFKNFTVSANYTGSKPAGWDADNYNHHTVVVRNLSTGKKCRFDFWASLANPEIRTEEEVLHAFACFVRDSIYGEMDYDEFCDEFGYNTDSRIAEKAWKACGKSNDKLRRIFPGDINELDYELTELYG